MDSSRQITRAVGLAMFVDASLYLAILPVLPIYADRFDLSTLGAGILIASYPASTPVVSLLCIPWVPRYGARRIALASAWLMLAATVLFALAPNAPVLIFARFLQGMAAATVWTSSMAWVTHNAPAGRRGRESGIVMGLAAAGSIAGPGVGALGAWIGLEPAFLLVAAAAGVAVVLTARAPAGTPVPPEPDLRASMARAVRQPATQASLAVAAIDPLAFASVDVLVPLGLDDLGTSATAIAAAFTSGAVLGAVAAPLGGRLVDRIGPARVAMVSVSLIATGPLLFAAGPSATVQLLLLVALSAVFSVAASAMFPLASAGADAAGVAHVVVTGLQGAAWAIAFTAAPLAVGFLADRSSDEVAFVASTLLCLPFVALLVVRGRSVPRQPEARLAEH